MHKHKSGKHGRKGKGKGHFTSRNSKQTNASRETVTYAPSGMLMPFPPKYRCKMVTELYGNKGGATAGIGRFIVNLNTLPLPWHTNLAPTDQLDNLFALPSGVTCNTVQCTGFIGFANANLYTNYKISASKIEVEFAAGQGSDTINCAVTPSAILTNPPDVQHAMTQPLTKVAYFNSFKPSTGDVSKKGTLKNYQHVRTVLGLSKVQMDADTYLSSAAIGQGPTSLCYWVVNWGTAKGDNLGTNNLGVKVKVTYYVTFWNQTSANLPEV